MIKQRTYKIAKGLTRAEAMKRIIAKKVADFRGFSYDPKTGIVKVI